jgi:diguanylate cyclase (GGDEF)-like protein
MAASPASIDMEPLTTSGPGVTEEDWGTARGRARHLTYLSGMGGVLLVAAMVLPAVYLSTIMASGTARYPVTAAWLALLMAPLVTIMVRQNVAAQEKSNEVVAALASQFEMQARGQKFESRLANALDMAEGEAEVVGVIERSFASTVPKSPVELLLADNSHAHLLRMAVSSPTGVGPGCGVDSPDACPAARRAQVQRFPDSEVLDACPKLQGRPEGRLSALCVPVSIMGRTVGVIHATGPAGDSFGDNVVQDLETLAKLAGARIGLLRVMAETQLQATTDSLTGLLNRRSFEQRMSVIRRGEPVVTFAMADLDHFKMLNDRHGHETGDRALRLFAQVLSESVRTQDLVCRHGGEEFVVALPGCTSDKAREIFDALRVRLGAAVTVAGLPNFTVSIGLVEIDAKDDTLSVIGRADAALFKAKADGRDRVVVVDAAGRVVPEAPPPDGSAGAVGRVFQQGDPLEGVELG